jgi:membrane protein
VKKSKGFLFCLWNSFYLSNGFTRVGSLSYTVLLSFIPFSISVASIIGLLPISVSFTQQVEKFTFANFLPSTGESFYSQFTIFLFHSKKLSLIGFAFLLLTAFTMLRSLEKHINEMWQVKAHRSLATSALVSAALMIFGPLLLCFSIFFRLYVTKFMHFSLPINLATLNLLSYFIATLIFILIYKVIPVIKVKFADALFAGLIAGALFELAKRGFIVYASHFSMYNLIYGSLAFIPLFLLWIYISILILLFCAQIIFVLNQN